MTTEEAETALKAWATVQRNELVLAAHQAGVSKYRISQITGIARPTIDRILKAPAEPPHKKVAAYLTGATAQWPKVQPGGLTRIPGMANVSPEKVAEALLADTAFRALKLGTWLSTPPGDVLTAAVTALSPPLHPADADLLVKALAMAARRQHEEAQQKLVAGLLGGAAVALVIGSR
jgi:hypothetical protein